MISIRFSVYGIAAYGGYAVVTDAQGEYTSLFIYGAVNAPIGGVPAFFVTGIGAGVGVNRLLLLPDDLDDFPDLPADPGARRRLGRWPTRTPRWTQLRAYFPPDRGAFWFAAGLSFTSFSLVEGVAVDRGGDRRRARHQPDRPRARRRCRSPSAPLVQIELALLVRFSSSEGVLWVQAQLTDNSFLLTRDCRLTGGFAYVMWFTGPTRPASSCSRSAATTRRSTATATRSCRASASCGRVCEHPGHQGRELLRADLRGDHGGCALRGVADASGRCGPTCGSAPTGSSTSTRSTSR